MKVTVLMGEPGLFKQMNQACVAIFTARSQARAVARLGVEIPGILVSIEAMATL